MKQWLRFQVSTPSGDETYPRLNVRQAANVRAIAERPRPEYGYPKGFPYRLTLHRMGHGTIVIHDDLREKSLKSST